ncbi:MAG: alpha/beta family hydrolase [Fulvivirga sp.]
MIPFKLQISDTIGEISCEIMEASSQKAAIVLAHGAGAGMHHQFMVSLSNALAERGITSLRYQFPYLEAGKKRPDPPAVAQKAVEAVVTEALRRYDQLPVYAGGKSFGGRMTSLFAANATPINLKGLVFYGFPLHPPGKPSVQRAAHLKDISCPMLFLQGTRDKLAEMELIKQVTEPLPQTDLIELDGADHSFHMLKKYNISDIEVIKKLSELTSKWMKI